MATKIKGYYGKLLRVDLTNRKVSEEELHPSIYKKMLGGAGIGTEILYKELDSETDPFDPENRIIFATGPFQATRLPGSAKFSVISKSPLTDTYSDSAAGGSWGINFKRTGYDLLIIQGKASKPVYIFINNENIEIEDAQPLWGEDAVETFQILKKKLGSSKISVAAIGPAGERLVRFACIVIDGHSFAGRCGLGAVMGAKNLKAIAVCGNRQTTIADPDRLEELAREQRKKIRNVSKEIGLSEHGTSGSISFAAETENLPVKYWNGDLWEKADKIGAPAYTEILKAKPDPCLYCPIACHRYIEIEAPEKYILKGSGPQYESLGLLGPNCLIDDLKAVAKANDICNRLGMDTISAGSCVGFAMECFEQGWITKKDSGGLEVKWGSGDDLIELLIKIGNREDIGDLLAEGTQRAAQQIGKGAEEIVVQVRGLDFPSWDPRSYFATAINYATGTRGACHERGLAPSIEAGLLLPEIGIIEVTKPFEIEEKVDICIKSQNVSALFNSLVICDFMINGGGMSLTEINKCFNAVTGWDWSIEQLMEVGERVYNLQRMINIRDGKGKTEDKLPPKCFIAAKTGFRKGKVPPLQQMLAEYYEKRNWNYNGGPDKETLKKLGLEKIVDPLT